MLGLFGNEYAQQGLWVLRTLVLAVFPLTAKAHYVATCRVSGTMAKAARHVLAGALLETLLAVGGASAAGLTGLAVGWLSCTWKVSPLSL